jgi:hypothetical protein
MIKTENINQFPPIPRSTQLNTDVRADFKRGPSQRYDARTSACHLCRDPNHWIQECPLHTDAQRTKAKQNSMRPPQVSRPTMHPNLPPYQGSRFASRDATGYLIKSTIDSEMNEEIPDETQYNALPSVNQEN